MHVLSINNISFSYDFRVPTLRDLSLDIQKGEFLGVIGPNGSGKTTLLRLLDRIFVPHKGTILLGGRDISSYPRSEIAKRIAFLPQENNPQFPFTVLEMVLMGRSPHIPGMSFENSHDRTIAFDSMKLTDVQHLADHPITALSGGERQRVFIARALAQEPEVILLDEPNAHLDITHQIDVMAIMKKLNRETGLTVVSVSHDLNLAAAYSDRVAILVCGTLTAVGTPHEVLTEERIRETFHTQVFVDRHPLGNAVRITPVMT
jgi:iron complex transport system ATP-binding protein